MSKHGREVRSIERWVAKGVALGWCKPVPSDDAPGRFRRRFAADLSMGCEDPKEIELWGRYNRKCEQVRAIFVDIKTRCRRCDACLKNKARFWTARARDEFERAGATYMVTLTLRPEEHYRMDARMAVPLHRGKKILREGVGPLGGLASATLFKYRAREIGYEITDMLKRIRKRSQFRYLLVAERHMKNPNSEVFGRPHFHMLLHVDEGSPLVSRSEWQDFDGPCEAACRDPQGRPVWHERGTLHDHAFVRQQWPLGFTTVKRCMDMKSAVYVCKYVSKDPMARVRASIG